MNNDHTAANLPFQMQIQCAGQGQWAVVNNVGSLIRNSGADHVNLVGPGRYKVTFRSNMRKCSYVATIAAPDSQLVANPGTVAVAQGSGPDDVYVETRDTQGNLANYPFHLQTRCGNHDQWAVVGTDGNIKRSNGVKGSLGHTPPGVWEVPFNINMANCSYVASVGIPTSQPQGTTPVTPVLIFTTRDPNNPNGVLVETQDINRNYVDTPFHVQTVCN